MNPYGPNNPNNYPMTPGGPGFPPYPYPPSPNYPPPQNYPPYPPPQQPRKWYQTSGGIIALLILFFPAGLFLMWKYATWPKSAKWIVTGFFAFLLVVNGIANAAAGPPPATNSTQPTRIVQQTPAQAVPTSAPKTTTTPRPTAAPIHYPPTTESDLHGLAAKGNASAIHEFHSESVGLTGVCPQPKREVTVAPNVTGQQLAEDLLAYFYAQHLDNPCGTLVLAYHNQAEANDVYTAGRINLDVTDARGTTNVDPNASNLKYKLTLDIGGAYTSQEYVTTY